MLNAWGRFKGIWSIPNEKLYVPVCIHINKTKHVIQILQICVKFTSFLKSYGAYSNTSLNSINDFVWEIVTHYAIVSNNYYVGVLHTFFENICFTEAVHSVIKKTCNIDSSARVITLLCINQVMSFSKIYLYNFPWRIYSH